MIIKKLEELKWIYERRNAMPLEVRGKKEGVWKEGSATHVYRDKVADISHNTPSLLQCIEHTQSVMRTGTIDSRLQTQPNPMSLICDIRIVIMESKTTFNELRQVNHGP